MEAVLQKWLQASPRLVSANDTKRHLSFSYLIRSTLCLVLFVEIIGIKFLLLLSA